MMASHKKALAVNPDDPTLIGRDPTPPAALWEERTDPPHKIKTNLKKIRKSESKTSEENT